MKLDKIRIGFDPTNSWDKNLFREFIKELVLDKETYEVFLVTTNPDVTFINNVINESGMDPAKAFQVPNDTAVVASLNTNAVLMYFSQNNPLVDFVNSTIPLQLIKYGVVGCQALVLNNIVDPYKVQQKYLTYFKWWQDQILKQYD